MDARVQADDEGKLLESLKSILISN